MTIAALPDDTTAVLVLNVDQPRPHDVIARLVDVNQPQEYQKARASYFGPTGGLPGQRRPCG